MNLQFAHTCFAALRGKVCVVGLGLGCGGIGLFLVMTEAFSALSGGFGPSCEQHVK